MRGNKSDESESIPDTDERLKALRERLDNHGSAKTLAESSDSTGESAKSGIAQAWRLSSEFIAGILVGVGLGWGFDLLFGTSPWGLIGFLFLGFGAAVLNVLRASGQIGKSSLSLSTVEKHHEDKSS